MFITVGLVKTAVSLVEVETGMQNDVFMDNYSTLCSSSHSILLWHLFILCSALTFFGFASKVKKALSRSTM